MNKKEQNINSMYMYYDAYYVDYSQFDENVNDALKKACDYDDDTMHLVHDAQN